MSIFSGIASAIAGATSASAATKAQGRAADLSAEVQREAMEEQRRQFEAMKEVLSPYVNMGNSALDEMSALLGMDYEDSTTQSCGLGEYEDRRDEINSTYTSDMKAELTRFKKERDEWQQSGEWLKGDKGPTTTALDITGKYRRDMADLGDAPRGDVTTTKTISGDERQKEAVASIENSARFKEMVRQGEEGIMQNSAATGGVRGGNTQGALAQFRPSILSGLIEERLNQLGGLAGMGANAAAGVGAGAQNLGNAAQGNANMLSNILAGQGDAAAQSALAQGQAISGAFNNIGQAGTTAGIIYGKGGFNNLLGGTTSTTVDAASGVADLAPANDWIASAVPV